MRFSEWLKTYRKAAKLSQDKLAEMVGSNGFQITGSQISNYEREYDKDQHGRATKHDELFVEIAAKILNRPVDEARLAAGYAPHGDSAVPEELAIMDYDGFDKNDLEDIAEYIQFKREKKLREKEKE